MENITFYPKDYLFPEFEEKCKNDIATIQIHSCEKVSGTSNYHYTYDVTFQDEIYPCELTINESCLSDLSDILSLYGSGKIRNAIEETIEKENIAMLDEYFLKE